MTNKQQYDAINTARNKVKAVLNDIVPEDEIYKDHLLNEAYVYLTKFIEACKEDEYEYFYWDDNAQEYRCENDKDCYLSETPWHHLLDEVKIIREDFDKDINVPIKEDCLTCRYNQDDWNSEHCDGCSKAHSNYEPFVMYYPQVDGITPYVIIEGE